MKTYEMRAGMQQNYEAYTDQDRKVWKTLYERQMGQLQHLAHEAFIHGLDDIGFKADEVPNFAHVNARLKALTGWQIVVVPGIINERDFFQLLAQRQFPSSTWLRSMEKLDYLPEPDMFHDAFGHMPLLTNPEFCHFFQHLGKLGCRYIDSSEIVAFLGRMYWFTVEFGLIQSQSGNKIYGAGILSSYGETLHCMSAIPTQLPFDVKTIVSSTFDNTQIQQTYFVLESFEQLMHAVEALEALCAEQFEREQAKNLL